MSRIALGVSYAGTHYAGLQRLNQVPSIAAELETALSQIANHPVHIYAAGRTDKGVHALQQVIHFDSNSMRQPYKWLRGANAFLPQSIRLLWAQPVSDDFHARFSALSRRYAYLVYNGPTPDAPMSQFCHAFTPALDSTAMLQACSDISGEYDCTAFTTSGNSAHNATRHIDWIGVHAKHPWVLIDIQANAFVHRMVRMLVTILLQIGSGLAQPSVLRQMLQAGQQRLHKIAAPASGLFLTSVSYSPSWNLPMQSVTELWPYRLV